MSGSTSIRISRLDLLRVKPKLDESRTSAMRAFVRSKIDEIIKEYGLKDALMEELTDPVTGDLIIAWSANP